MRLSVTTSIATCIVLITSVASAAPSSWDSVVGDAISRTG